MGLTETYLYDTDEQIVRAVLNTRDPRLKGITYDRLRSEGWASVNLPDPWLPFAAGKFPTPSGKCEFYSETWARRGLDPLAAYIPAPAREGAAYPLRLLTAKTAKHFLNSSHAGIPRASREQGHPFVQMNPKDAEPRGITDGDQVRLFNERGTVHAPVQITPSLLAGVVAMSHGWWASRLPNKSSANALTRDGLTDAGGGGDFHDTRIQVAKA
jgi:anaerobic selenocysteine-containing dehydrogenase